MLIVVGLEIATLVSLLFDAPMVNALVSLLLPFVWLLFESAKRQPARSIAPQAEAAGAGASTR